MKTAIATLAALLTMAACLAFAEPGWFDDGVPAAPDPRTAKEGECIWTYIDSTPLRDGVLPQYASHITVETRTKLCYHGWTYSLVTFQRFVTDEGKVIFPWNALEVPMDPSIRLWLATDRMSAPKWGNHTFLDSENLPE